jgi:hypothetical protein
MRIVRLLAALALLVAPLILAASPASLSEGMLRQ